MAKVAIVYHSGFGHTKVQAEAVHRGALVHHSQVGANGGELGRRRSGHDPERLPKAR